MQFTAGQWVAHDFARAYDAPSRALLRPPSKPQRVLLLDDHPGSCSAMSFILKMRGHACVAVATIDDALAETRTFQPEVILYEWQLARGRCRGIANILRAAIAPGRTARIFVLSVSEEPEGFRDHDAIDAYFTKPINMSMLDQLMADA